MRTKLFSGVAIVLLLLTACGSNNTNPGNKSGNIRVFDVNVPDGRVVTCISETRGYAGGLSCDWAGAR